MTKFIFIISAILLNPCINYCQDIEQGIFLESNSKSQLFYIELNYSTAIVYQMGKYMDVAGIGSSIHSTDTLLKLTDGTYLGKTFQIVTRNQKPYLKTEIKNNKEFELDTSDNLKQVHVRLNNAYFLDHFLSMSNEINKIYPLNHYSFRNGFSRWKQLPEKEINPRQFRNYADLYLKNIKDSISSIQNQYVSRRNNLLNQDLKNIEYSSLKDSLTLLIVSDESSRGYFGSMVREISKQNPEYYFRLAEDFPQQKSIIFSAVDENKQVIQSLKEVKNHDVVKKEFFKDRKFSKSMPYKIIGTYIIIAGLITLLIVV